MAVVTADRAKELSTTTGTGAFTLAGAVSGFQSWATAFGSGVTAGISYCIHGGSEWEVGKGSFNGTTMVLTRTTVEASSNAGAAVNFSAGAKEVFATFTEADATAGGGGGSAYSYLGYNTVGGSTEVMTNVRVYMKKITVPSNGFIMNVQAHVTGNAANNVQHFGAAVLTDSAGDPLRNIAYLSHKGESDSSIILASAAATPVARWLRVALAPVEVTAGDYWIAVVNNSAAPGGIYYDGSGSDRYYDSPGYYMADAGLYAVTTTTNKYSIRAAFLPTA